jgi:hypothetical protein
MHCSGVSPKASGRFFAKKLRKKLLLQRLRGHHTHYTKLIKVFWFFFSKKNCFLASKITLNPPNSIDFCAVKTYPALNPGPYALTTLHNL